MSTNVNQKSGLLQVLEKTPAGQLPAVPEIANRFKELYAIIHPGAKADLFYEAEKFHFTKLIRENANLADCSKLSLYGCFMDVAVNGLSFDPSFKHLYIVPFNTNTAGKGQPPKWEKRAQLQISGYGELVLRQLQGQIKHAENPVLVYEGDEFSFGTRNEKFFIEHIVNLSKRTDRIIACYVKIVRHDGSSDYKVLTEADMERFKKFSKDKESKAWTDGLAGMWISKCIKHAFKNYPKVRTGKFSELASNQVDEEPEETTTVLPAKPLMQVPEHINYGNDFTESPTQQLTPVDDNAFMEEPPVQQQATFVSDDAF